ncbi:MAG: flagellar basal-body MS-ring/collar protein FliF [Bryobacterales bacterium]|nr:flagellar basal-body MS-ring/collar protein FliF [Bryobacteraceae bacterium]MDW8129567.1 flagellar basal-body MS-ring/collar protein FliF [Bryobacterales bacterium]
MNQIRKLLASLTLRQKISLLAVAALVVGGLAAFTNWRRQQDFRLLFAGLAAEDAAAVTEKLRAAGTDYRLADNGTAILVPSARVAELRLQMAAAGLPRSGRIGFELFDRNNFGASDFTEQVNYRRALEGELERSVMALAEVEQARVHVTFPKDSVFVESRQPAKASVLVRLKPGARLAPASVQAICYLVASAVEGLAPEAVAVLDMRGNLLNRARPPATDDSSELALELRQRLEKDLLAKIHATLEPVLGADRFRAGVSVECDLTSGEQSEEIFDPSRSVMVTSQKSEDISGAQLASGVPGTASNLPRPTSRPGSTGAGLTRRSESITYQATRTVRRTKMPQGAIKRLSIAVLLDQQVRWEGTGPQARRILEPPPPERLKAIRDLVAAATGLVPERGDQLIVESLPFETTLNLPPPEPPAAPAPKPSPWPPWVPDPIRNHPAIVTAAAGALVLLLAVAAWLLARKRRRKAAVEIQASLPAGAAQGALEAPQASPAEELEARLAEQAARQQQLEAEALSALKLPPVTTKKTEVLAKHLTETVKKNPASAAQILRSWLYETDK